MSRDLQGESIVKGIVREGTFRCENGKVKIIAAI